MPREYPIRDTFSVASVDVIGYTKRVRQMDPFGGDRAILAVNYNIRDEIRAALRRSLKGSRRSPQIFFIQTGDGAIVLIKKVGGIFPVKRAIGFATELQKQRLAENYGKFEKIPKLHWHYRVGISTGQVSILYNIRSREFLAGGMAIIISVRLQAHCATKIAPYEVIACPDTLALLPLKLKRAFSRKQTLRGKPGEHEYYGHRLQVYNSGL